MYFNLDSLSYDGKELAVSVFQNDSTDFAFYVLLAEKNRR